MMVLPCGDRALLAEFESLDLAVAAHAAWSNAPHASIVEMVPGARTVLVRIDTASTGLGAVEQWLVAHAPTVDRAERRPVSSIVTLPIYYDGDDLDDVATAWGCSVEAVATRHASTEWVCGFIGFAPGFAYLVPVASSLPPVPRRETSRPRVASGSVALAAEYCGIYPRESPGGWQLIGRTTATLWNTEREPPALIVPGTRVRFEEARL
jgi:KipI family sensor histidine kinase inhibitor